MRPLKAQNRDAIDEQCPQDLQVRQRGAPEQVIARAISSLTVDSVKLKEAVWWCKIVCKVWANLNLVVQEEVPEEVQSCFTVAVHQLIHHPRWQAGQVPLAGLQRCECALQVVHL